MRCLTPIYSIAAIVLLSSIILADEQTLLNPDATELLIGMEEIMIPEVSRATIVQTIETSSGGTRDFTYIAYTGDSGKSSLMRYTSPARLKNEAFLMLNNADDIWSYFSRTRRIRKLASHARKKKIMGSDVTYEDVGGGRRYRLEYIPRRLPDTNYADQKCYVLELTPREGEGASYERLVCYLRTDDYYPLLIDYYKKKDELLKTLYLEDIKTIEGRPTAMKMIMHNKQDDTKTIMITRDITYNVTFDGGFFTERNLKP